MKTIQIDRWRGPVEPKEFLWPSFLEASVENVGCKNEFARDKLPVHRLSRSELEHFLDSVLRGGLGHCAIVGI